MEDFNQISRDLQALNKAWEEQKKVMDRQNNISSNIGRFLGVLSASLLPVGMFGTFFSISKVVNDHNYGYYWLAVLGSWLTMLTIVWLWGAHGRLDRKWWRYHFWKPITEDERENQRKKDIESAGDSAGKQKEN
jgi:hypothetical protein